MCTINWSHYITTVMPQVSPSAWKVFCFLLAQPTATVREIAKGAGLGSTHTVCRAVAELAGKGYMLGSQPNEWQATTYTPGPGLPVAETATPVANSATASVAETATESTLLPVAETATLKGISIRPKRDDEETPAAAEKIVSTRDPAIQLYREFFPYERWKKSELDQLAPLVDATDLDVLRDVLTYWQARGHGRNIGGIMSRYQRELAQRRQQSPAPEYFMAPETPRPRASLEARARVLAACLPSQRAKQEAA